MQRQAEHKLRIHEQKGVAEVAVGGVRDRGRWGESGREREGRERENDRVMAAILRLSVSHQCLITFPAAGGITKTDYDSVYPSLGDPTMYFYLHSPSPNYLLCLPSLPFYLL